MIVSMVGWRCRAACGIGRTVWTGALLSGALGLLAHRLAAQDPDPALAEKIEHGRVMSLVYCSACHVLPSPDLLTKSNWVHGALRTMSLFLGVTRINLAARPDGELLKEAKVFPEAPLLPKSDWEAIVAYYSNAAPAAARSPRKIGAVTDLFAVRPLLRSPDAPCTTLLQIDGSTGRFFVGDAQTRTLKLADRKGTVLREWKTDSGPVALSRFGTNLWVTLIGRILPSDETVGQVWQLAESSDSIAPIRVLRNLRRPVHMAALDVNNDGKRALVISCFGNRLGSLSLFLPGADGAFGESVLYELAGAVRALPFDWNDDGLVDLTVLRAQAREGADLYFNEKHGQFARHPLWEDPSANGNAFFDLADFDQDGRPELLVLNGDNGDFEVSPKSYHGIRVFAVNNEFKAELRFRFPFPGAYGARAADFDLDGDVDIAAVSYFPDYTHAPDQCFVYLRNEGQWKFTPHLIRGLNQGRWIMLDAGDLDGDGDADLLLGSFSRGPLTIPIPESLRRRWESEHTAVLLLENKTRNQ